MRELSLRQSYAAISNISQPAIRPIPIIPTQRRFQSSRNKSPTYLKYRKAWEQRPKSAESDKEIEKVSEDDGSRVTTNASEHAGIVEDLNSTRPPPLNLPTPPHPLAWPSSKSRDPKNWDFKYLFALGKTYGKFYWAGIKQVWANQKTLRAINERTGGFRHLAPDIYDYIRTGKINPADLKVTYDEFELHQRARRDLLKLLPFGLVFLVCGEFTPLAVVLLGSRVVPSTCVIPKQAKADLNKTLEREETFLRETAKILSETHAQGKDDSTSSKDTAVKTLGRNHKNLLLMLQAYRLNLAPKFTLSLPPFLRSLYLQLFLQRRIYSHCSHLLYAAYHIQAEGGWSNRSAQDIFEFGNAYGLHSVRAYAREALAKNREIATEEMKRALLPVLEDETAAILEPEYLDKVGVNTAILIHREKRSIDTGKLAKELERRVIEKM